jgi:hypothetical protein
MELMTDLLKQKWREDSMNCDFLLVYNSTPGALTLFPNFCVKWMTLRVRYRIPYSAIVLLYCNFQVLMLTPAGQTSFISRHAITPRRIESRIVYACRSLCMVKLPVCIYATRISQKVDYFIFSYVIWLCFFNCIDHVPSIKFLRWSGMTIT